MNESMFAALDPAQLRRIESTHRGFLYQHVCTAGCLLLAGGAGVQYVAVERDDDVEIRLVDRHAYCQVKTRTSELAPGDLEDTLARFDLVRFTHKRERSSFKAEFWIISNAPPSAALLRQMAAADWPADVRVLWPGHAEGRPPYLPPPWRTIEEGVRWCAERASSLPSGRLPGDTLTWKLAAVIQHACTGPTTNPTHRFDTADLPQLFEQIVLQLHRFPAPPAPYRDVEAEPAFDSDASVRLIVGLSGAGKSGWASEASRHSANASAYFDAGEIPSEAVPAALAREIVAQLALTKEAAATALAPGLSGLETLRALSGILSGRTPLSVVVIDNAHRVTVEMLAAIVAATPSLRWLLLAQPSAATSRLAATLGISAEALSGYTLDSIAAEFKSQNAALDTGLAARIAKITGKLPLFVKQAASLSVRSYGGDSAKMCDELERGTHVSTTPQELILSRSLATFSLAAKQALSALTLSDVSLSAEEARELVASAIDTTPTTAASALRELAAAGVCSNAGNVIIPHDSFRLAVSGFAHELPTGLIDRANRSLFKLISKSVKEKWQFDRQAFLLRLLVRIGDIESLIDIATSNEEQFTEFGFAPIVRPLLEKTAAANDVDLKQRFWALDTLNFWALQDKDIATLRERLPLQEKLFAESGGSDRRQLFALTIKQLLFAGQTRDAKAAQAAYARAAPACEGNARHLRILRYDYAHAMFCCGRFRKAAEIAAELVGSYYEVLGLEMKDVLGVNPPEIFKRLGEIDDDTISDIKRLADTLDMLAQSHDRLDVPVGLARMHAFKFFTMATAVTSAVRVGQDLADDFVAREDPAYALKFIDEQLMPIVARFNLLGYLVRVRAQRAMVLAHLGRGEAAHAEMKRLLAFDISDPAQRRELEDQAKLVDVVLAQVAGRSARRAMPVAPPSEEIGRNDRCSCNSGKKYKKCCMPRG